MIVTIDGFKDKDHAMDFVSWHDTFGEHFFNEYANTHKIPPASIDEFSEQQFMTQNEVRIFIKGE